MFRPIFTGIFLLSLLFASSGRIRTGNIRQHNGTVTDPSGALVAGATVQIANPVTGYTRTTTADASGHFQFFNIPFNPYRLTVTQAGFHDATRNVEVNSGVPFVLAIKLDIAGNSTSVTVEIGLGSG